jgi:hypothetical protein
MWMTCTPISRQQPYDAAALGGHLLVICSSSAHHLWAVHNTGRPPFSEQNRQTHGGQQRSADLTVGRSALQ